MISRFPRAAEVSFRKAWLSDPAVYPLMGIIGVGVAVCSYCSVRYLTSCPDVLVTQERRHNGDHIPNDGSEEKIGKNWTDLPMRRWAEHGVSTGLVTFDPHTDRSPFYKK